MLWGGSRESTNVEDRRGSGRGGLGLAGGGLGTIALLLVAWFFGIDPRLLFDAAQQMEPAQVERGVQRADNDPRLVFVRRVLGDTEDTWTQVFRDMGRTYRPPVLTVFDGALPSGCGIAQPIAGPFYCPRDQHVYLDLGFFDELHARFGVPGEFAQAYVIAHEVGHHVQHLLGLLEEDGSRSVGATGGSVRTELQADCFAGVWATRTDRRRGLLERGDIESGIAAATAVGDDTLQQRSQGRIVPDAFTHGTSTQRVRWFQRGLERGDIRACDTFHEPRL
jgi:uncharacterized protein